MSFVRLWGRLYGKVEFFHFSLQVLLCQFALSATVMLVDPGHVAVKKNTYVEKKIPTTILTASASASLAVSIGLRLGHDNDIPAPASKILIDTITGRSQISEIQRKPGCPCCGLFDPATVIVKASPFIDDRFFADIKPRNGKVPLWSSDPILVATFRSIDESRLTLFLSEHQNIMTNLLNQSRTIPTPSLSKSEISSSLMSYKTSFGEERSLQSSL